MKYVRFILNLPFTLTGVIPVLLSIPYQMKITRDPLAFIFYVRSLWWFPKRKSRAKAIGHIILLSPKELKNDLEHELIHIRQCEQYPFIFPFLYAYETLTKGYRMNRFEDEAYKLTHSVYNGVRQ